MYSFAVVLIRCLNPVPHQLVDEFSAFLAVIFLRDIECGEIGSELKQQRIGGRDSVALRSAFGPESSGFERESKEESVALHPSLAFFRQKAVIRISHHWARPSGSTAFALLCSCKSSQRALALGPCSNMVLRGPGASARRLILSLPIGIIHS
jgi:hypothetical protein